MYKLLSTSKKQQETEYLNIKSYSDKPRLTAGLLAVCFVAITMSSCGNKSGNSMFPTSESAAGAYRSYLSEIRTKDNLSTGELIKAVNEWQSLRDSVFARIGRDTMTRPHHGHESVVLALHDSLRIEFSRLALTTPRSLLDALLIREQTSGYRNDKKLMQAVAEAKPFFNSLDSVPAYGDSGKAVVDRYGSFLAATLESGINSKDDMLTFIKEEDRLFRSFLARLPELACAGLSAITQDTEKCCMAIFRSAGNGSISYMDALVYTARRTARRIVLNVLACRDDINQGRVRSEGQARAYAWMLLQPCIALDGLGMAVMSDAERETLYEVAGQTPSLIASLDRISGMDDDRWKTLPELAIRIMIESI